MAYNLKNDFIDYWDEVIRFWLDYPQESAILADRFDGKRPCYKETNQKVNVENFQMNFFNPSSKLKDLLCPAHMPEPYWGNPCKCSIVIINYNPGGGTDMNPHTYKFTNGNHQYRPFPPNTLIEFVNRNCYSQLALDFPLWNSDAPNWIKSYGGFRWWQEKKDWVNHIVDYMMTIRMTIRKEKIKQMINKPFAIELCGWHSVNWPDNTRAIDRSKDLKESILQRFVLPLLKSIENSRSQMAVCIGAQFKPDILKKIFDENQGMDFHNMTSSLKPVNEKSSSWTEGNTKIQLTELSQKRIDKLLKISDEAKKSIAVEVIKTWKDKKGQPKEDKATRYYRIYNIKYGGKDHIILNTYAPGSNHHPAKHFRDFEKKLLEKIWSKLNIHD